MIIEFFGPAGVGKTTQARFLAEHETLPVIKIQSKAALFWYNFLLLVKNPVVFFSLLVYVFRNSINFKMLYYKLINIFFHTNAKYQMAKQLAEDLSVIIDQGYLQSAMSIFERKVSKETMSGYLKRIFYPDKLIILTAGKLVLAERIKNRGYFAREFLDAKYHENWREVVDHNYQTFLSLVDSFPCETLMIDAGADLADVSRQISEFIKIKNKHS